MAETTGYHHGIDYIELAVTDMARAKAFYEKAFGWKINDYGPGGPLVILYSADLEASAAAVRAAGGTVTKEIFEFPGGRRFEFADPFANQLGVWGS